MINVSKNTNLTLEKIYKRKNEAESFFHSFLNKPNQRIKQYEQGGVLGLKDAGYVRTRPLETDPQRDWLILISGPLERPILAILANFYDFGRPLRSLIFKNFPNFQVLANLRFKIFPIFWFWQPLERLTFQFCDFCDPQRDWKR